MPSATDAALDALADATRRRILTLLAEEGEATATTLAAHLPMTRQAVVHHLAILARADLTEVRRRGREVLHRIRPEALEATARWMETVARGWDARLAALRRLAEADDDVPPARTARSATTTADRDAASTGGEDRGTTVTTPTIAAGTDIALKIPRSRYEATVAFYRDTLGFEVTEEDPSATPTVSRTHRLRFGPVTLWLDQVDSATRSDVWLQLVTDDLDATMGRLEAAGTRPVDELEPFTEDGPPAHWIQDPAGVVHLLLETAPPGR